MDARRLAFSAFFFFTLLAAAQGRRMDYRTPEQLTADAKLVCNGEVVSVSPTNLVPETQFGTPPSPPETVMEARIKVLHVFKGGAAGEIVFRYNVLSSTTSFITSFNVGERVQLNPNGRYRFFLLPTRTPNIYYSVLWWSPDECYAVQTLWPNEPDDGNYLSRDELIRIATKFLHRLRPGESIDAKKSWVFANRGAASGKGMTYNVSLSTPLAKAGNSSLFVVRGDGSVDPSGTKLDWPPLSTR